MHHSSHNKANGLYHESMDRMMTGKYRTSDCSFLRDMAIHHDIAVVMARDVFRNSDNPRILEFARSIIHTQQQEIAKMRQMQWSYCQKSMTAQAEVPKFLDQQFAIDCHPDYGWGPYQPVYRPLKRDQGFHQSMQRMDHLFRQGLDKTSVYRDDAVFLHDMIYHHQVAVEMANDIQRHTQNPDMLVFVRQLIWNQSKEIWHMVMMYREYDRSFWLTSNSKIRQPIETSKYGFYLPRQSQSRDIEGDSCLI